MLENILDPAGPDNAEAGHDVFDATLSLFEAPSFANAARESRIWCADVNADAVANNARRKTTRATAALRSGEGGARDDGGRHAGAAGETRSVCGISFFGVQVLHGGQPDLGRRPPDVHRGGRMGNVRAHARPVGKRHTGEINTNTNVAVVLGVLALMVR